MNRKQLTILIVLGLLIGGLGFYVSRKQSSSWEAAGGATGQKLLGDFPLNDVAHVVIKEPAAELNLVRQDDLWRVKERWNYPANFSEVGELLRKMWEIKTVQSVKVGPSNLGRLELLPPDKGTNAGTLLEFRDKSDKPIRSLLLGKKYVRESQGASPMGGGGDFPVGRFVMHSDQTAQAWLVSDPLTDVEAKPDRWLNKDFFKVEKLRSISVTSTNPAASWKLGRDVEAGPLAVLDKREDEIIDTNKLSSAGHVLSSPYFSDVVSPEAKPEDTGMAQPLVATLETFDNFKYTVKIGSKTADDNYHLNVAVTGDIQKQRTPGTDEKPEDKERLDKEFQEKVKKLEDKLKQEQSYEKWVYLVSKWTVDPLLKERKDFYQEKKEEEKKDDSTTPPPLPSLLPDLDGAKQDLKLDVPLPPLPEGAGEEKP